LQNGPGRGIVGLPPGETQKRRPQTSSGVHISVGLFQIHPSLTFTPHTEMPPRNMPHGA